MYKKYFKIIFPIYFVCSIALIGYLSVVSYNFAIDNKYKSYNLLSCESNLETLSNILESKLSKDEVLSIIKTKYPSSYEVHESESENYILVESLVIEFDRKSLITKVE